jgi:hypothetical protein
MANISEEYTMSFPEHNDAVDSTDSTHNQRAENGPWGEVAAKSFSGAVAGVTKGSGDTIDKNLPKLIFVDKSPNDSVTEASTSEVSNSSIPNRRPQVELSPTDHQSAFAEGKRLTAEAILAETLTKNALDELKEGGIGESTFALFQNNEGYLVEQMQNKLNRELRASSMKLEVHDKYRVSGKEKEPHFEGRVATLVDLKTGEKLAEEPVPIFDALHSRLQQRARLGFMETLKGKSSRPESPT